MTNLPNNENSGNHAEHAPMPKGLRVTLIVLASVFVALMLAVTAFLIIRSYGKSRLLGGEISVSTPSAIVDSAEEDGTEVSYNGSTYRYNENVVSILFMGVDKKDINTDNVTGINGQADSLFVAALDTKTGAVRIVPISRETMVDVNVYSAENRYTGVEKLQLCLAYAYGATGSDSCENVRRSVSRLLYGIDISSYVAIDLDGVRALTKAIGGVRLTPIETLERGELSVYEGRETSLSGDRAVYYIQERGQDLQANNRRMQRQKQFLNAFASQAGNKVLENFTRLASYYNTVKPYLISDLTFSEITYLASTCLVTDIGKTMQYYSVSGTLAQGKYVEFTPDRNSLYEAVLNAFYIKEE